MWVDDAGYNREGVAESRHVHWVPPREFTMDKAQQKGQPDSDSPNPTAVYVPCVFQRLWRPMNTWLKGAKQWPKEKLEKSPETVSLKNRPRRVMTVFIHIAILGAMACDRQKAKHQNPCQTRKMELNWKKYPVQDCSGSILPALSRDDLSFVFIARCSSRSELFGTEKYQEIKGFPSSVLHRPSVVQENQEKGERWFRSCENHVSVCLQWF